MPESRGRKRSDPRARSQQSRRTKSSRPTSEMEEIRHPREGHLGSDFGQGTFEHHAAILGDSRLSSPANAAQRASLVLQLQRDYGNQYVQRLVDHVSKTKAETVQRQDEEEELQMKPLQRQDEEEELQMKPLQRQDEEEELQMKPLQRQDEEEELQMKPLQRQEEEEELQMKPLQRQEEEEELQMKPLEQIHTSVLQAMVIQRLPKPAVSDSKLNNLVNELYHGANAKNKIGDGSTADAIRYEKKEGKPVGGKWHTQKGQEYLAALNKWMERNQDSAEDVKAAQAIIDDLKDALK